MTKAHTQDLYGVAILLAIFIAALFLAKLFAGAVIGIGGLMFG